LIVTLGLGASKRPAPPSRASRRVLTGVLSIVVAVVVAIAFVTLNFGLLEAPSGGVSAGAASFAVARSIGNAAASILGTWGLTHASAYAVANATPLVLNPPFPGPNCNLRSITGPIPSSVTLSPFSGDFLSGVATDWLLNYQDAVTNASLVVIIAGTEIVVEYDYIGAGCFVPPNPTLSEIPAQVGDSGAAASAMGAAGGRAWLEAHPTRVSLEFGLNVNLNLTGVPVVWWQFLLTTCPLTPSGMNAGATFVASVLATSEQVFNNFTNNPCGGVGGLASSTPIASDPEILARASP